MWICCHQQIPYPPVHRPTGCMQGIYGKPARLSCAPRATVQSGGTAGGYREALVRKTGSRRVGALMQHVAKCCTVHPACNTRVCVHSTDATIVRPLSM